MARTAAAVEGIAPAGGPYSHGARIGDVVAVSGQGGFDADGQLLVGLEAQTNQALINIRNALAAFGLTTDDVITMRVYLTEQADFEPMNEVYREFFTEPYPARTTVFVGLYEGLKVEIDALAVIAS